MAALRQLYYYAEDETMVYWLTQTENQDALEILHHYGCVRGGCQHMVTGDDFRSIISDERHRRDLVKIRSRELQVQSRSERTTDYLVHGTRQVMPLAVASTVVRIPVRELRDWRLNKRLRREQDKRLAALRNHSE